MAKAAVRGWLIRVVSVGLFSVSAAQAAGEASSVIPGSKAAQLDNCVEPTEFMRRNHMEVIKHQRDATVREGVRSTEHSLSGCVDCHVSYGPDSQPVPVDGEDQFCSGCHEFAAVEVNCFGCHASMPVHRAAESAAHHGHPIWNGPLATSFRRPEILKSNASGEGTQQ